MARNASSTKNFDFTRMDTQFPGYNSANDPSKIDPSIMVGGSLNVYKKINGNLANRPGKALYSPADTTSAPVTSQYVWNKSNGLSIPVAVWESDSLPGNYVPRFLYNDIWYSFPNVAIPSGRWVFDKWWSSSENNDYLVGVSAGVENQYSWSGGIATVSETSEYSIFLQGQVGLTGTTTCTGTATANIQPYFNASTSNLFAGTLFGRSNPAGGETLIFRVNGVSNITITFVGAIGVTEGNVLIGATLADTITNLRGMLENPGTTSATQVALSAPNQTAMNQLNTSLSEAITKTGTTTFAQEGFTNGGTGLTYQYPYFVANGLQKDYNLFTGSTLALSGGGLTVSGISPGDVVYNQIRVTPPFTGTFKADFCKTVDNQVYVGSYNSQLCYVSQSTDPFNFTISSPAVQGSANLIVLDGTLDGITVRNGKPYIGVGGSKWAIVNYTYSVISTNNVRQTNIEYTPVSAGAGAYAHEFIDQVGDSIVYLSQDQQVRTFGSFNTSFTSNNYPSLSQEIYTELQEEVFSNSTFTGNLRAIGDYIYVTSPISGLTYLYQARQAVNSNNQVIVERLWHAPMDWNLTRVDLINNTVIGFSNVNPQIYQLWDTDIYHDEDPSGETFAYTSTLKFAYDGQKRRQGLWSFDKVFTEGYITPDTELGLTIKYNYLGTEATLNQDVNSEEYPVDLFTIAPTSLGDSSWGESSLGMGGSADATTTDYSKFKTINQFALVNTFEWQIIYQSELIDSQWEILAKGTNANVEPEQDATFIINQQ